MADDLDENFDLDKDLSPSGDEAEEDDESVVSEVVAPSKKPKFEKKPETLFKKVENTNEKKKNKKKNITEVLKTRGCEINKPKFSVEEFKKILKKYIRENLSSVEKNDLNLSGEDAELDAKLESLIMKRGKVSKLKLDEQFNEKFNKKLENFLKKKEKSSKVQRPFVLILSSSAIRCIEIQKQMDKSNELVKGKRLRWMHAFAKHKKLNEQIEWLEKSKSPTHLVFGTPQRVAQLVDAGALKLDCLRYVMVDYSHRDCKLKRFVDIPDIRQEFLTFTFKHLLKLNKEKNKLKFYLS